MYSIKEIKFKTKSELTDCIRKILYSNNGSKISDIEYNFMMDVFKHHPDEGKCDNVVSISVGMDKKFNRYPCFYIHKSDNTIDDISFVCCIKNIK